MVKFTYFLHYRSFSGSSDGKINYFKMLYNKIFSIKHIYIKMSKSHQKEYRDNITDEQEQERREAIR